MRPQLVAAALLLALALAATAPAGAQTFLRDDTGAVAPPVVFTGSGGAQTRAQGTDPLPVTGATATPTSSTTDASGWGRRWFQAAITYQTSDNDNASLFTDEQTVYAMAGGVGTTREIYRSSDRGVSFTFVGLATLSDGGSLADGSYVFRTALGRYLYVGTNSGITTARPFHATNLLGPWTVATIPAGVPVARANGGLAQQGATLLLAITDASVDQGHLLRSTNDGVSWATLVSPTGLQGFTQNAGVNTIFNTGSIASPALNIWLAIDNDGRIFRSTNDGLSFAQVQQIGAASNTFNGVTCVDATTCVAWNNLAVFRSTNAGSTWSQVATLAVAPRIMVSLGSGVVIAATTADVATEFFRSGDSGVTWEQLPTVAGQGGGCAVGNYTSAPLTRNGAVTLAFACTTAGVSRSLFYSPVVGGGQTGVVGASGVQWDINSSGAGGMYQGAGAANSGTLEAWQTTPVQRGTLLNSETTGAANTAVVVTLAAVANARAHLYRIDARCSAGTSNLTVQDGATTIWSSVAGAVGTAQFATVWAPGLTGTTNTAMTITLAACGVGNTGTLTVQADRF